MPILTRWIACTLALPAILASAIALAQTGDAEKLARERAAADTHSVYIIMRDGVRIAADVHLPKNLQPGRKIPALLYQTIYLRSHRVPAVDEPSLSNPGDWRIAPRLDHKVTRPIEFMALEHGYALIKTDVRGTGASFGTRNSPLPPAEVQDNQDIIDWIIAQDWSDGRVGAFGVSYTGMTAGMAPIVQHPALKAIVLGWSGIYDEYKTAMQPYGLVQPGVLCAWSDLLENLWSANWRDTGKVPMPVDGDEEGVLLRQALAEHNKNETVCDLLSPVVYSDDLIGRDRLSVQSFSQRDYKAQIEASGVAMLSLASWYDTGASDAHFVRLRDFSNPQKIYLTGGQHGARFHASPYLVDAEPVAPIPSGEVTWGRAIQFFDHFLKGEDNGYDELPAVTYWNLGEEAFRSSGPWPVAGTTYLRFYLDANHTLGRDKPTGSEGSDTYQVDFDATTGPDSRWWTGIGKPMLHLADRRAADDKLLVYTSEPLAEDLQITGWPIVSLNVSSTHSDGAFIVYLEDVDETGKSTYVNEGGLRALHRRTGENPVAGLPVPYHSFARQDAAPLVPGEMVRLHFEMIPTSVRLQKGHRLRIAIAGADRDNFVRIPERGDPVITVYRNASHPSWIDLPVLPD